MNFLFWGMTVSVLGKVLLAIGVLIAHTELAHEKRVDNLVLKGFKIERVLTIIGIILILFGYTLELYFYGFDMSLLTCFGNECMANISSAVSQ